MTACFTIRQLHFAQNQIDRIQRILALIVAGREVSYFLVCLYGLCVAPHYLLANATAGWWPRKDTSGTTEFYWWLIGMNFAALAVSPEKWILGCIFTVRR